MAAGDIEQQAQILIGTSGYSYKDWVGPVYPSGTPESGYLEIYAAQLPTVELNFSFYRQPDADQLESMLTRTPEEFRFALKANRTLTHEISEGKREQAERFRRGVEPLAESGRLAAVLAQFPYSFHYTTPSRRHLAWLCGELAGLPLAVEFRNTEWYAASVYEGLATRNVGLVNVDAPSLPKLPPPTNHVTSDISYVRFHGRNREQWWTGDNVTRYDYLYDDGQLSEWIPRIRHLASRVKTLLVYFNNHPSGRSVTNAMRLRELLRQAGLQVT